MKKYFIQCCIVSLCLMACNNTANNTNASPNANLGATANSDYITATINGTKWQSITNEILATYQDLDDKLQIFTKDDKGKMNFLITIAPFNKTGIGDYSSVKEGAGGFGISLLDDDRKDNVENDYDNYHQGAVANCIKITSIKNIKEGRVIKGTFASPMNVSNNYVAARDMVKAIQVTDGKFSVFLKN